MSYCDDTSAGGGNRVFETTRWARIKALQTAGQVDKAQLLECLARSYWKPVYCYLRRKGYDNESAKDLTQGFFCEVLLGRDLMSRADRSRGRFRDFLVRALENYVTDEHRRAAAHKRSPVRGILPFDEDDPAYLGRSPSKSPEQAFFYGWVTSLLDNVLAELKRECHNTGKELHWRLFEAAILKPLFDRHKPPMLGKLCTDYGIDSEQRISNMLVTVKRRFRAVLRRHLLRYGSTDKDVQEQLDELIEILTKSHSAR